MQLSWLQRLKAIAGEFRDADQVLGNVTAWPVGRIIIEQHPVTVVNNVVLGRNPCTVPLSLYPQGEKCLTVRDAIPAKSVTTYGQLCFGNSFFHQQILFFRPEVFRHVH